MARPTLLVLCAFATGCVRARSWEPAVDVVRHIRFEGNGGAVAGDSDYLLVHAMEQEASGRGVATVPFSWWIRPPVHEAAALERDAERIETWYAHHGWLDARFLGWEIVRRRPATPSKAGVIDLVGKVAPGEPSLVRSFDLEGLPPELVPVGDATLRGGAVVEGQAFSLDGAELARSGLEGRLRQRGYARATVALRVDATPAERAVDVHLVADVGGPARVGEVTLTGLDAVPERAVRAALPFAEGDPWRESALTAGRRALFGLGTFSVVEVTPDREDREDGAVPVRVDVTEGRFRRARVGAGVEFDGVQLAPRLSAAFAHNNLAHQVLQLRLDGQVGLETAFGDGGVTSVVPTYGLSGALSSPRRLAGRVRLELSGGVEQDVATGLFAYRSPYADVLASASLGEGVRLRGGPHFEQYTYLVDSAAQRAAARRSFGRDFTNPYQLVALDQGVEWDRRDDPLDPTRGTFVGLSLREAVPLATGDYSFVGAHLDLRGFLPLRLQYRGLPLVLAATTRLHDIEALGASGVPWPEQVFLGGATSIRGFRADQVGPYDLLCAEDPFALPGESGVENYVLPHGGTAAVESSVELRATWWEGFRSAFFVDGGLLAPRLNGVSADLLRFSAGTGLRYDTVVGPLRFDVSGRPLYPEDFGPTEVIDCAPGEDPARVSDLLSTATAWRGTEAHPPFALVFFLAIGEAF